MLYHLWQLVLGFNCGKTQTISAGDESALDSPSRSPIFIGTWKTHPACSICNAAIPFVRDKNVLASYDPLEATRAPIHSDHEFDSRYNV